eukprot:scaffold673074_cov57-Prasinocladus_malaysianus.AAC.1
MAGILNHSRNYGQLRGVGIAAYLEVVENLQFCWALRRWDDIGRVEGLPFGICNAEDVLRGVQRVSDVTVSCEWTLRP